MSLFRGRQPARPVEERGQIIGVTGVGRFIYGGIDVSPLRSVAHFAARQVMCQSVAGLPVQEIVETRGSRRRLDVLSPVVESPSAQVDQQAWVYQVVDSFMADGNAYGLITFDGTTPTGVEIIDPGQVTWWPVDGVFTPHVGGKEYKRWPAGPLWHVPYVPVAGSPKGLSPSEVAEQSVYTSLAAEKFGGDFFAASGHPTYDVAVNAEINEEQAHAIKTGFLNAVRNRSPWVHGASISASAMNVDPKSSQFIELLQFECLQAARIYRVPPSMIYAAVSGSSVTYANASQDDLAFLKHSLRWPIRRLQFGWSQLVKPHKVRFNVDAFLEMTAKERTEIHGLRLTQKTRTVNEVRMIEDELPFDDPAFNEPGIPGGGGGNAAD